MLPKCQTTSDLSKTLRKMREAMNTEYYMYSWTADLYLKCLDNSKPTYQNYVEFHKTLMQAQKEEKLEVSKASGETRRRLMKQKGMLALDTNIKKWQNKAIKEGKVRGYAWMVLPW